ncbi:MAG: protein tyrosine phosphatase [Xanthobacteraceae bacterium]|nr:protein tyrosine phosphatase [Xanthobacteraceae bacterium]
MPAEAIHVAPLSAVAEVARQLPRYDLVTLLSPGSDAAAPAALTPRRRLHLAFHDIAEPRDGLIAPDAAMIAALLDFGRAREAPLLIHCWAGVSRSSAAAYVLACDRHPGREREFATALRARAPFATPNALMVRLADDLLGRHGAMAAAIAAIGRGAEAREGTPYRLGFDF